MWVYVFIFFLFLLAVTVLIDNFRVTAEMETGLTRIEDSFKGTGKTNVSIPMPPVIPPKRKPENWADFMMKDNPLISSK